MRLPPGVLHELEDVLWVEPAVITANPGCQMQLEAGRQRRGVRVLHMASCC